MLSSTIPVTRVQMYGGKPGAIKGFKFLEKDTMGKLELCGCSGS